MEFTYVLRNVFMSKSQSDSFFRLRWILKKAFENGTKTKSVYFCHLKMRTRKSLCFCDLQNDLFFCFLLFGFCLSFQIGIWGNRLKIFFPFLPKIKVFFLLQITFPCCLLPRDINKMSKQIRTDLVVNTHAQIHVLILRRRESVRE